MFLLLRYCKFYAIYTLPFVHSSRQHIYSVLIDNRELKVPTLCFNFEVLSSNPLLQFLSVTMSTLSEAYEDLPLDLQHIKPVDFASLQAVPDSHVWHDSSFGACSDEHENSLVPVIDLEDSNATELIGQACETLGVFQLKNHGIPLSLIEEVESEAARFFALSARQKLKALRSPGGATGYGIARIAPFFSKYMWHEGFTIMGSPVDHVKELWPHDHERFW